MPRRIFTVVLLFLFFYNSLFAQLIALDSAIKIAVDHRQTQNAAHNILWGISHNVMEESWSVNQEKGEMTVQRGTSAITCKINIIGTYNTNDSTFLWSIYNTSINKKLTGPVKNFIPVAEKNKWKITGSKPFTCSFQRAMDLSSIVSYYDNANGISRKMTNQNMTIVIFTYYDIEIRDRMFKVFNRTIPTKKQYKIVDQPELIELCRTYVTSFGVNEKKYTDLYSGTKNYRYYDTMFANRIKISDTYWDTTSISYPYFRKNRLQAQDLSTITNWRVIVLDDDIRYVLYDEKEPWGGVKTWAFEMCEINKQYKIRNEFMCL